MNDPFSKLSSLLSKNAMTASEKRRIRATLVSYATEHPVKSGLMSPYTFRFASLALASLVLVLGGSIGVTSAAKNSLPNQSLYPIKMWVEEFEARNQKTPEAQIAFETERIETRFDEARRLALRQELNDHTSAMIQSGLEHSRANIKITADAIQSTNPELALAATNRLETSFSSNGKILASIERNTGQNVGSIVLAAQVTTEKLASERVKFEQIVALKPNVDTKATVETKLASIKVALASLPAPKSEPVTASVEMTAMTNAAADIATPAGGPASAPLARSMATEPVTMMAMTMMASPTSSGTSPTTSGQIPVAKAKVVATPQSLVDSAEAKIADGKYSEALVLLEKAARLIDEAKLTKSLEATYNVKVEENTNEPTAQ